MAKSSSAASAQSAAKELAAQQKILDTLEKRANTLYDSALTGKNPMITDAANVEEVQKAYRDLAESIRQVRQSNSEGSLVDVGKVSEIERNTEALNQLVIAKQKVEADAKSKFESQLTAQMKELDTYMRSVQKTYDSAFSGKTGLITDEKSIEKVNAKYKELRNNIEKLKSSHELISREDINKIKKSADELQNLINKKRELENTAPLRQVETFRDQMTRFLQSNPKVLDTSLGSEVKGMLTQIESGAKLSTAQLNEMRAAFSRVKVEARQAGVMGKTFSDSVMDAYRRFGGWSIITNSLGHAVYAVKEMITNVVNLDTAMTELKKVTDETDATYEHFFTGAADRAREIGATVTDTITATADFARLGYDIDQASALADAALVYKNVGDGIENISDASDSIISTMMAFEDLEGRDPMRIVDAFNELGKLIA